METNETNKPNETTEQTHAASEPKKSIIIFCIIGCIISISIGLAIGFSSNRYKPKQETAYDDALFCAQCCSDNWNMSKQEIKEWLIDVYGKKLNKTRIVRISNLVEADYNANALETANEYYAAGHSKETIYEMLTSNEGDKFTTEEAQYAIDNLE